jgi:hypothetical protein
MYFLYRIRFLIFLLIVVAVAGGIYYFISQRTYEQNLAIFETQVEAAVATAVENALINVTRTAEAPLNTFQLIQLGQKLPGKPAPRWNSFRLSTVWDRRCAPGMVK